MPHVEPADDCTHCTACTDYVAWLEGQLLAAVDSYGSLARLLGMQVQVAESANLMAELLGRSRDAVHERRLGQIERHLSEGDQPSP